ncbi:MAG: helix-turn-helix domain-containing protein [Clostridia bacterium]|nr:helix-turn-helix domain-containing protein [Clostridia bacterium]
MTDIKGTIAKNISELRQANKMTQLTLAEKLNYSDKAVSKWERGESIPDVTVLLEIADIFNVSLDELVRADCKKNISAKKDSPGFWKFRNRALYTGLAMLMVWLISVIAYVLVDFLPVDANWHWLLFIYSVPLSLVVWLVMNSLWFNKKLNYIIISLIMWSILASVHITALMFGRNLWLVFLLGIPGQIILFLASFIKKPKALPAEDENKNQEMDIL